jgi:hypothetical protein
LEASGSVLSIAMAVASLATLAGVTTAVRRARAWGARGRMLGYALLGLCATLLVFLLQSVSVGASPGGVVLALAVGGTTLLVLMLISNA